MSDEKSIFDASFIVTPADNGGFIVSGRGENNGKEFAFSDFEDFACFIHVQHSAVKDRLQ